MAFDTKLKTAAGLFGLGSHLSSFFSQAQTASASATRAKIEDFVKLDKFLFWGSLVPVVGSSFAMVRVAYGSLVIGLACCEVINKMATQALSGSADKSAAILEALKEGALPTIIYGAQHVGAGLASSSSIIGKVSMVAWEILIKPKVPQAFIAIPSIDLKACTALFDRVKNHSLILSISKAWDEFVALAFAKPTTVSA